MLVAVGTGVALGAVTAGRRADATVPAFVAAHGYDAVVYAGKPLPLAPLPNVARWSRSRPPSPASPGARAASELPAGNGPSYDVFPSAAFTAAVTGTPTFPFYQVQFRHGGQD